YLKACSSADNLLRSITAGTPPYTFFNMPIIAEQTISNAHDVIARLSNTRPIDIVMLIGIGGSSLGTQAIYAALQHHLPDNAPQLWCADTVDPVTTYTLLKAVHNALDHKKNIVVVIVSKSGTTLETCTNASLYIDALQSRGIDIKQHVIIITDQQSPLET